MSVAPDSDTKTTRVFVRLLDEGTDVSRPVEALALGDGLFKILPTPNYDAQDETWEFPPGSVVRTEIHTDQTGDYLLAVQR